MQGALFLKEFQQVVCPPLFQFQAESTFTNPDNPLLVCSSGQFRFGKAFVRPRQAEVMSWLWASISWTAEADACASPT